MGMASGVEVRGIRNRGQRSMGQKVRTGCRPYSDTGREIGT